MHNAVTGIPPLSTIICFPSERANSVTSDGSLRQRRLIWLRAAHCFAATAPLHPLANIASSLERETDRINCAMNEKSKCSGNGEAGRRKGESRASSPFPLGGFSALPHTGGIPRPLEARPYGQTMPTHLRVRHLDLTTRRQQALIARISLRMEPQHLSLNLFQMAPREVALASRESKREQAIHPWLNLKYASQMESLCPESVIMRPAAACDWSPRQRRLIWVGAAYRLAVAALLPPLTYVASSLGYELDRVVQELDNQGHQAQESMQPVHRQFTSSQGRRRYRLTGLTPLTYRYYSRLEAILQTYVRYRTEQHGVADLGYSRFMSLNRAQECRGNSPALDGSPCTEIHPHCTAHLVGHSIIYTNICSPYRKAA